MTETKKQGFIQKIDNLIKQDKNTYTVGELLDYFGTDSIIAFMFCITFITSLPLPPWGGGFETIPGGLLCILLSLQGIIGIEKAYAPEFIRNKEIDISLIKESKYTSQFFELVNSYINPDSYVWVFNSFTLRIMYIMIILCSSLMLVPIIFTNGPPSQCITLLCLTWLLYDGFLFGLLLCLTLFILFMYVFLFFYFGKWLYRTRKTWTFGLWH
jgi:hypothetical protein